MFIISIKRQKTPHHILRGGSYGRQRLAKRALILLVEDNEPQARVTGDFLKQSGYDVVWAKDGKSAIKNSKTMEIEAVLLDLNLPDMNGTEVCKWLKKNPDTKGLPVIMLTEKGSLQDKVTGFESGADDYLPKPYNEIELNARIYAALRTKGLQDELRMKNRQLEELLERVKMLAITDPLTEVYNRRQFENIISVEFDRTRRYRFPLSCLMVDVDRFKLINDEHGHQTGDLVLKELAKLISMNIRNVDVLARWGGEEFVVLMPHTDSESAHLSSLRLLKKVSEHEYPRISGGITVSIGVASADSPEIETSEHLIHRADLAMYEAKKNGRNRVELAVRGGS